MDEEVLNWLFDESYPSKQQEEDVDGYHEVQELQRVR